MENERERVIFGSKMKTKRVSGNLLNVLLSRNSHIVLYRRALNLKEPSSHPSVKQGLPAEGRGENCSMRLREIHKRGMWVAGGGPPPDSVIRCADRAKKVPGWSIRRQSSVTSTLHGGF